MSEAKPKTAPYYALSFCEQNPRYRHCGVHLTYWSFILGALQFVAVVYNVVAAALLYPKLSGGDGARMNGTLLETSSVAMLVWAAGYVTAIGCGYMAVWTTHPKYLIALFAVQGITLIMSSIEFIFLVTTVVTHGDPMNDPSLTSIVILISGCVSLTECYFIAFGVRLNRYLTAKSECLAQIKARAQPSSLISWSTESKRNERSSPGVSMSKLSRADVIENIGAQWIVKMDETKTTNSVNCN